MAVNDNLFPFHHIDVQLGQESDNNHRDPTDVLINMVYYPFFDNDNQESVDSFLTSSLLLV